MKISQVFSLFVIFFSTQCFAFEKSALFDAIDQGNASKAIAFFNQIESVDHEEAYELITEIYQHYVSQFGSEIFDNREYQRQLGQYREIYRSILKSYGIALENSLISNRGDFSAKILLCKKKKKDKIGLEAEVPGSMVLGGVEILGGVLICILPFPGAKRVGGMMIGDGIRRTFNGLEEIDKENKTKQKQNSVS